ncbi:hypothetical protein HDU97_008072 [Phlyctochytrium planicorne]|nr:hypothetical protein HDU97_008072 [Phlyctochytrium planicorne]
MPSETPSHTVQLQNVAFITDIDGDSPSLVTSGSISFSPSLRTITATSVSNDSHGPVHSSQYTTTVDCRGYLALPGLIDVGVVQGHDLVKVPYTPIQNALASLHAGLEAGTTTAVLAGKSDDALPSSTLNTPKILRFIGDDNGVEATFAPSPNPHNLTLKPSKVPGSESGISFRLAANGLEGSGVLGLSTLPTPWRVAESMTRTLATSGLASKDGLIGVLKAITSNAADSLGLTSTGRIKAGSAADLVLVRIDSNWPLTVEGVLLPLFLAGALSASRVEAVIVDGTVQYSDVRSPLSGTLNNLSLNTYYVGPNAPATNGTQTTPGFSSIEEAIRAFKNGEFIIAVDNEDRENEGDLIIAAEHATDEKMAFMIRYTSGLICVSMTGERLDALELPLMVQNNQDSFRTAYTISVDLRNGVSTGISSGDRARTIAALADPKSVAADFNRPGHVLPLRAKEGGVLKRVGHTEASVDLCKLAGLNPAAAICEVVLDEGGMARRDELKVMAKKWNIKMITIADLVKYRLDHGFGEHVSKIFSQMSTAVLPPPEDKNFLSVTDPLTQKTIRIPISAQGTISASLFTGLKIKPTTPPSDIETDTVPLRLYDPGFKNTVVCRSKISEVDGDSGKLYYRGYDVVELVEKSTYLEVSYLLINGQLPTKTQADNWSRSVMLHTYLHTEIERQMLTFRYDAHPMGMLISTIASLSTFHPDANPALQGDGLYMIPKVPADREPTTSELQKINAAKAARTRAIVRMLGKIPTIAANAYRHRIGREYNHPMPNCLNFTENLLYMIDKLNEPDYKPDSRIVRILDKMFILLAEHGSNCSTVMMRHLASSGVDPYTALSGAAGALFGERKSSAVIDMLRQIGKVEHIQVFLSMVKRRQTVTGSLADPPMSPETAKKNAGSASRARPTRLMGFGHRIYKTHDPRVRICKNLALELFDLMGKGELGELALALEEAALSDEWFVKRGLFPNIDFWSAVVFHTLGFPPDMFPVLMCIPRVAGLISHWQESLDDPEYKIYRPRQVYIGEHHRPFERQEAPTPFAAGSGPAKVAEKSAAAETADKEESADPLEVPYKSSDPVAAKRRTTTFSNDAAALAQLSELISSFDAEKGTGASNPLEGKDGNTASTLPPDSMAARLALGPVSSWIVRNFFAPGAQNALGQLPQQPEVSFTPAPSIGRSPQTVQDDISERVAKTQAELKRLLEEQQRAAKEQKIPPPERRSSEPAAAIPKSPNSAASTTAPLVSKATSSLKGSQPDLLAGSKSPRVLNRSLEGGEKKEKK